MRKLHLLRGPGGLAAEIDRLRSHVHTALAIQEQSVAAGYAPMLSQAIGVVDKVLTSQYGIANDADTTLTLVGYNFDMNVSRENVLIGDVAGINSGMRLVALTPGDPKIDIAMISAAGAACTYTAGADGRHKIWITYQDGVSTPTNIRTVVAADPDASLLLAVVGYTGGTGGGAITAGEFTTTGAAATAAGSTYIRLGNLSATNMAGADSVTAVKGTTGYTADAHTFQFGHVTTTARYTHSTTQYPINQAGAVLFPSDTCLMVLVDGDHAAFTATLTINHTVPFMVSADGVYSDPVSIFYVDQT